MDADVVAIVASLIHGCVKRRRCQRILDAMTRFLSIDMVFDSGMNLAIAPVPFAPSSHV
jgi:hypothetical protein